MAARSVHHLFKPAQRLLTGTRRAADLTSGCQAWMKPVPSVLQTCARFQSGTTSTAAASQDAETSVRKRDANLRGTLSEFGKFVADCLPKFVQKAVVTGLDELEIMIAPEGILPVLSFLKGHHNCMFWSLADIGVMDVPTRQYRFLVLVLICLTSLGSYFCYDNPAALQKEIKRDMQVDTTNFMILYSVYSWPNVIVCFFGGYLIDRVLGVRLGAIIFGLLLLVGHYIFAIGAFVDKFWVMILGRVIFGLGGENLQVAVNAYAVNWFKGSQLNLVMGLGLSVSRAGSVLNMNIMEPIYNALKHDYAGHICLGLTLFIGGLTLIFSQYCTFHLAWLDRNAEKKLKLTDKIAAGEKISLRDIKDFPPSLWLLSIICVGYYTAIFPFIGLGLVYFQSKYDLDPAQAKIVNSLIYTISAFASPAFGFMIDRTGRNLTWTLFAVLSTIGGHALLAFSWITPYVAVCIMGLSYSMLASSLWPMVALVVKESQLGTAYGIMQAVQNLGLAVFSIVTGLIADTTGYLVLEVFFLGLLCVALLAGVALYLYDAKVDGALNLSVPQATARAELINTTTTEVLVVKEKDFLA